MPSYCFRIRFVLGLHVRIQTTATELLLRSGESDGEHVVIRPRNQEEKLGEAVDLVVRGGTYETAEQAEEAATRWEARLRVAFAELRIGADFGRRAPTGGFTPYGLKMFESSGQRPLNDAHGIMVFECEPPPVFVAMGVEGRVGKPGKELLQRVAAAANAGVVETSERNELAFDLYSASFFQPSPDARFLMLMMALETLIEQEPRGQEAAAHVAQLVKATENAEDLSAEERESLLGALRMLRQESVGAAGGRLAASLGERTYMEEPAARFFRRCYEIRGALVHGHYPRPDRDVVGARAANLEGFVGDLLSVTLLTLE